MQIRWRDTCTTERTFTPDVVTDEKTGDKIMTRMCITKKEDQRFYIRTIRGDCLEKAGVFIPFGGYVIIDGRAKVNIGDLVICGWCLGDLDKYIKH